VLDQDKLSVYKLALAFRAEVEDVLEKKMAGRANLADQLQRAATSVVLNIAEGSGRFQKLDKARFYSFAIGSAAECAAVYDILLTIKVIDSAQYMSVKQKIVEITAMLTSLRNSLARRSGARDYVKKAGK